jgi:hypothetical protein
MSELLMVGGHVKWEVFWVAVKKKRKVLIVKDFGNDLTGAIDLYTKAKKAGKPFVTLRSKNVAFPPPAKYQPRLEWETYKVKVRGRTKPVKKRRQVEVIPMVIVNHRGVVWCPYCREFRHFQKQDGFRLRDSEEMRPHRVREEGIYVQAVGYYCICGINTENGMVRKYNPNPPRVVQQTRRSSGAKRRRTRTR